MNSFAPEVTAMIGPSPTQATASARPGVKKGGPSFQEALQRASDTRADEEAETERSGSLAASQTQATPNSAPVDQKPKDEEPGATASADPVGSPAAQTAAAQSTDTDTQTQATSEATAETPAAATTTAPTTTSQTAAAVPVPVETNPLTEALVASQVMVDPPVETTDPAVKAETSPTPATPESPTGATAPAEAAIQAAVKSSTTGTEPQVNPAATASMPSATTTGAETAANPVTGAQATPNPVNTPSKISPIEENETSNVSSVTTAANASAETGVAAATGNGEMVSTATEIREPARLAEAHRSEILEQVTQAIDGMARTGKQVVHLQLYPEELGRIDLRLTASGAKVGISLTADQTATGKLLETSSDSLRQSLADAGIQLSSLDIGQQSLSNSGQGQAQTFLNRQFIRPTIKTDIGSEQTPVIRIEHRTSRVDYRI